MKNFEFEHKGKKYWYSRSIAVVCIVIGHDDYNNKYVLANKRGENTPDWQGFWNLPCGYLDFDETVEQAIQREVYEETGVKINIDNLELFSVNSIPEGKQNVTIRFKTDIGNISEHVLTDKNSEFNEVDDIKWINLNDINNYEWAFNHIELIKLYTK